MAPDAAMKWATCRAPARERVAGEPEVDAARGDERGAGVTAPNDSAVADIATAWGSGVDDVGPALAEDATAATPRRGRSVARRQADEIRAFDGAPVELALGMRHEHRPLAALAQPEDGQERLLLSAAPGAGRVDVEAEHSSQSLAHFRPT